MYKELSKQLEEKLKKHHELYRLPCRAEQWEDIFDQCINPKYSSWVGSGHDVGADVISENGILFEQNIPEDLSLALCWNGLPQSVHFNSSTSSFISQLKIHLYRKLL